MATGVTGGLDPFCFVELYMIQLTPSLMVTLQCLHPEYNLQQQSHQRPSEGDRTELYLKSVTKHVFHPTGTGKGSQCI